MRTRVLIASLAALAIAASAAAQGQPPPAPEKEHNDYIALYLGGDFGGNLFGPGTGLSDIGTSTPRAFGAAVGFWGNGMLSGELDFCYHPEFFGPKDLLGTDSNLLTLTASFVVNPTIDIGSQRIRPYFLIGGGLMRSEIKDFIEINPLGKDVKNQGVVDIGGGVQYYFHPRVGVRGDIRYFKGVGANDDTDGWGWIEDWDFLRGTIGIAFTF